MISTLSEYEIKKMYRHGKNKQEMVRVLADLTLSNTKEIAKLLYDAGEEIPEEWTTGRMPRGGNRCHSTQ